MGQFVELQPVSHDQHLNNSNASYEDFKATIPSPLIDKDLFASYPEQSESRNPYPYSPDGDFIYKHHLKTNQYGIDYYVKSGFDKKYPIGSPERADLEKSIINDYLDSLQSECHDELWGKWTSLHPHGCKNNSIFFND
ncbi:chaperone protein DnaJ 49-like protein [Tanacetum coccineum]